MRVRHPYALDDDAPPVDDRVHWGGRREWSDVDDDGTFYVPDGQARAFVERWPEADGYDAADLLISENGVGGDSGEENTETTDGSDRDDDAGTCAGTTASGDPCGNPAGEDGYCQYHGPEDADG